MLLLLRMQSQSVLYIQEQGQVPVLGCSDTVIEGSKDGYPELEEKKEFIFNVLLS